MPADGLFQFATEADRLAGDTAASPADVATADVADADAADVAGSDVDDAGDAPDGSDTQADADVTIADDATGVDADVAVPDGETATDVADSEVAPDAAADAVDDADVAIPDAITGADAADANGSDLAEDATATLEDAADALADDVTADAAVEADVDATATDAAVVDAPFVADASDVTADGGADADAADVQLCIPADCNDGNSCTADACDTLTGCSHTALSGSCDDGNPCTTGDTCTAGVCLAGAATSCDDGNACTADGCATGIGCSNTPTTAACSDGDPCTVGDACSGGACVAGAPMVCTPDGNPCTVDVCQNGSCVFPAVPVGTNCGAGQSCNAIQQCVANDGADMVALPAGTFVMGSPDGQGDANEQPQHTVSLAAFALDKAEVTVTQYAAFFAALQADQQCSATNGPTFTCARPDVAGACNWAVAGLEKQPVNCVDWFQAAAYCAWAGKRLPTEAEWEYAARSAGLVQTYPWGSQPADCALAILDDGSGAGGGCGAGGTSQPCSKVAGDSVQGACDLAGNVSEWCADWYDLYDPSTATDPAGPSASPTGTRILRGGSWNDTAAGVRATARANQVPTLRAGFAGFRCAKTL